jgi:exosortase O
VLLSAVLWLYAPVLSWLGRRLTAPGAGLDAPLMVVVVGLLGIRLRSARLDVHAPAQAAPGALALLLLTELTFVICARALDVHALSAALLGVTLYAALGLYTTPRAWREGARGLLLVLVVLPLGDHAELYLGVPARRLSAEVVAYVLAEGGVAHVPAETVLVLESGLVYVDAPCSGVRSLWTGAVFFVGATWLERARLDLRWLGHGLVLLALLVAANVGRVLAIVLLGPVAGWTVVAELVHEPLGILGVTGACAIVYLSLRRSSARGASAPAPPPAHDTPMGGRGLGVALAGTILALVLYTPPTPPSPGRAPSFALPGEPLPLTDAERGLFTRVGHTTALKRRFTWQGHAGSLLLVHSTEWRAHHAPEVCMASAGHRVEAPRTWTLSPRRVVRTATIDGGARTAVYWYQSAAEVTPELSSRVWSAMIGTPQPWVQVSLLLDGAHDDTSAPLRALVTTLQAAVQDGLDTPLDPRPARAADTALSRTPRGPS